MSGNTEFSTLWKTTLDIGNATFRGNFFAGGPHDAHVLTMHKQYKRVMLVAW